MTDEIKKTGGEALSAAPPERPENRAVPESEEAVLLRSLSELREELARMRDELGTVRTASEASRAPRAPVPSAGDLTGADDSLFSPSEVRAMSRAEVRANLDRIRESMRHWS